MTWIACKDRMPKDGEDVIFFAFGLDILVGFYVESLEEWSIRYSDETYPTKNQVTHWMPLPEPPPPQQMTPALIHHLVDTTAAIFGITPDQVRSPSRERPCVIARNIVADIAYNEYLFTFMAIGKELNRHYSTIIINLESFHNDCKAKPQLRYLRRQVFNNAQEYLQTAEGAYITDTLQLPKQE